jgi:DNA-binding MarR family transcriptional regulator
MGANRQNVQRIVHDLAKEGLVTLAANPHHRRASLIVLTDQGKQTFAAAMGRQAPWINQLAEGLRCEDIARTHHLMAALRRNLESVEEQVG